MGVPTGSLERRIDHTHCLLEAMKIPARFFSNISPTAGFGIFNARAGYLARVTETSGVHHFLADFDGYIEDFLIAF